MAGRIAIEEQIKGFERYLQAEEREAGTKEKYQREVRLFLEWLGGRALSKEQVTSWKEQLQKNGHQAATVNGKLSAVNKYLRYLGREECRVKYLKLQRRMFRSSRRELTKEEYQRLVETASSLGRERLALLMEAICATGIRVSEVRYLTVEAVRAGRADISLKGKVRTILLPGKLCKKLLKYAGKRKIASGEIFLTRSGKGLGRRQIWAEMKALCGKAHIAEEKVFPHNLRHLFARVFYRACRDVAKLADILGHSSIETTRLYLLVTGAEHARQLEQLRLVS